MKYSQRNHWRVIALALLVFTGLNLIITPVAAATPEQVAAFRSIWGRTDNLVSDGAVNQAWVWGPTALDYSYVDKYRYSPDDKFGQRAFRHYDKGRMEIDPRQPVSSTWYIRSGSLVKELVSGQIQIGEQNEFGAPGPWGKAFPAQVPIVGDPVLSDATPTYATFTDYATLQNNNRRPDQRGETVIKLINRYADTVPYNSGDPLAKIDTYETATGHNVPVAFSRYMRSTGQISENGKQINGPLFNPVWHFGYPITEAYWAKVQVGGQEKMVMLQLFERRVLSYTPSNPPAWQVEMGNVGQHYLRWRLQHDLTFSGPARISMDKFRAVLKSYGSPVTDNAEDFYNLINGYGLDPAVALGFFVRESGAGTANGYCDGKSSLDNKNWGNARGDRSGACGFQKFATWRDGLDYWCRIMVKYYVKQGLDRLEKAVPVYAPTADGNDVNEYLSTVYQMVVRWEGYKT